MSDSEVPDFQLTGLPNPLLRTLQPIEIALLRAIWLPIFRASDYGNSEPVWPVWDFVVRTLHKTVSDCPDPVAVLNGLPTIRRTGNYDPAYGLIWREDSLNYFPSSSDRVGLSIAGFYQLSLCGEMEFAIHDKLVEIISRIAMEEEKLTPNPREAIQAHIPLEQFTSWFTEETKEKYLAIPLQVVTQTLEREYARVRLSGSGNLTVTLDGLWLHEYRTIEKAEQYLEHIASNISAQRSASQEFSILPLVQTLDYLSYVLSTHPKWKISDRLVASPDLQSASAFVLPVDSKETFESRMNGVWNVINRLNVPRIPESIVNEKFHGKEPLGSITKLEHWLNTELSEEVRQRVDGALNQIKAVRKIRVADSHGSPSTRKEARHAHLQLDLPEFITNWEEAWNTVKDRLARAFDIIRQEVQSSMFPN